MLELYTACLPAYSVGSGHAYFAMNYYWNYICVSIIITIYPYQLGQGV